MYDLAPDVVTKNWLFAFSSSVTEEIMKDHITSLSNHLWHIFTWGNVPCLTGDEARRAFDKLSFSKAIMFYGGYSNRINSIQLCDKIPASSLEDSGDVYIVDVNYQWTYVHTHESVCGPYFCYNNQ